MARKANDLDIYKDAYSLLQVISHAVKNMRKDFKHLLGKESIQQGVAILRCINQINGTKDAHSKLSLLDILHEQITILQLNMRLCKDLHLIDESKFARVVELGVSVESQCLKWHTYIQRSKR